MFENIKNPIVIMVAINRRQCINILELESVEFYQEDDMQWYIHIVMKSGRQYSSDAFCMEEEARNFYNSWFEKSKDL